MKFDKTVKRHHEHSSDRTVRDMSTAWSGEWALSTVNIHPRPGDVQVHGRLDRDRRYPW